MNNKKTIQNILIGLGVAIAGLVVYSMLATPQEANPSTGSKTGLSSLLDNSVLGQIEETDAKVENAKILKVLGGIQNIVLKDDIFANPVFKKLKDSNFTIPNPLVIGRKNPFLPIGFESLMSSGSIIDEAALAEEEFLSNDFFNNIQSNEGATLNPEDLIAVNSGGQN